MIIFDRPALCHVQSYSDLETLLDEKAWLSENEIHFRTLLGHYGTDSEKPHINLL